MDSYLVCVTTSEENARDAELVLDSLRKRFGIRKNFENIFSDEGCSELLELEAQVKVSLLNQFALGGWEDLTSAEWHQDVGYQEDTISNTTRIADSIHSLADLLPATGSYKVYVIWFWDQQSPLQISDHEELYGSLKRLVAWHNGYLYFVNNGEPTEELQQWTDLLLGEVTSASTFAHAFSPWNTFWTGGITQRSEASEWCWNMPGFDLVQEVENEFAHFAAYFEQTCPLVSGMQNQFCFASNMELVAKCNIETIPSYVLTKHKFLLQLKSSCPSTTNSTAWLKSFNTNDDKKTGLIVRLQYTTKELSTNRMSDFNPTTENWKQMICNGFATFSVPSLLNTKLLTFLMVKDPIDVTSSKMYLLRNSFSIIGTVANEERELNLEEVTEAVKHSDNFSLLDSCLEDLPQLDQDWMTRVCNTVKDVQLNALNYWKMKLDEGENLLVVNSQNIYNVLLMAKQKCLEKLYGEALEKCSAVPVKEKEDYVESGISELLVDPNDWPERKALLHYELESASVNAFPSSHKMAGLAPNVKSYSYDCKDLVRQFEASGKGKSNVKMTSLHRKNETLCPFPPEISRDGLIAIIWPEANEFQYPDICYNKGLSSETEERKNCEIKDQYVLKETVSTFNADSVENKVYYSTGVEAPENVEQILEPPAVSLRRSPRLKNSSASTSVQSLEGLRQKSVQIRKKFRANEQKGNRSRQFDPGLKTGKYNSRIVTSGIETSSTVKPPETAHLQRMHTSRRPLEKKVIVRETSALNLTERQKKKLRSAVCDVLEEHGISLDHPLFQFCGGKLFSICRTFVKDMVVGHGSTTEQMRKIATSHVKQVIEFEKQLDAFRKQKSSP